MFKKLLYLAIAVSMSSCTMMLLEEIRGGHSPMMIVDGEWDIEEHVVVEGGQTTDVQESERCDFDATQDVGDFCMGYWISTVVNGDDDFLWGVDEDGEKFKIQANGNTTHWNVIELDKERLHIERNENGETHRMVFVR